MSVVTALPPADSPNTVTRAASPPKAPMFARTHPSSATWSRSPRLLSNGTQAGAVAREVEVAERAEPVVEAHVHDASAAHEPLALPREVARRARAVPAAVDEDHHRAGSARPPRGSAHARSRSGSPRSRWRTQSSAAADGSCAPGARLRRRSMHHGCRSTAPPAHGALNRRAPVGAAAYGMPRHASISPSRTPRTTPPVTRTSSPSPVPACAVIAARSSPPHSIPAAVAAPLRAHAWPAPRRR